MKKTILITGVRGFLGSALWHFLTKNQNAFRVCGLARRRSQAGNIFTCDLIHQAPLKSILARIKPAYIFNFAGGRLGDDRRTMDANFETTNILLNAVAGMGIRPRIIIPGSAAEYGNIQGKRLITENCLPQPLGWYGFMKLLQTNLGLFYARRGLDVVVARMFNICGANTPPSLSLGGFAEQIVAIERGARPVIKTKNLDGRRDFLDIEDICRGLWMIAQKGQSGEVYNLCSGRPSCIRELLHRLLSHAQIKGIRVEENRQDASLSFDAIGSNAKFKSIAPAWSARVRLEQSIKNTLASYRRRPMPL